MTNIATLLKSEIARVARKEVRAEIQQIKKLGAQYRSHIATLRRHIKALERQVAFLRKGGSRSGARADAEPEVRLRFSATRLATQRKRLGLSAAQFGKLVGVSAQSVYKWEEGKARPRAKQLQAIAATRKLGKREAAQQLGLK